jgi:hypothetical protein
MTNQGQVYLGSEKFVEGMQTLGEKKPSLAEIPRAQRRALPHRFKLKQLCLTLCLHRGSFGSPLSLSAQDTFQTPTLVLRSIGEISGLAPDPRPLLPDA